MKTLVEAKQDIENFKNKFGEKTYNDFIKAKDRLKNNNISLDIVWHTKNTSPEEMGNIIQSLYQGKNDKQKLRQIRGEDKEIRGKYKYFGKIGGYKVYQPLDYISSIDLGVNTGWCTTGRYGHAGHPDFTPSTKDAKKHWNDYAYAGVDFYYLLDPETMYGKYAIAIYPREVEIVGEDIFKYHIKDTNCEIYNDKDNLDYSKIKEFSDILNKIKKNTIKFTPIEINNGLAIDDKGTLIQAKQDITKANIPDSVTSIGYWAFSGCDNLTSINISNSVTKVGAGAFVNCHGLTSITIPNSVTSIGDHVFSFCSSLTSITIPNSVTSIGDYAFRSCSNLTSITIPNSVTYIGNGAFCDCSGLTSIIIPDSVISIGDHVFSFCSSLTSINISNSVTKVGAAAFYKCNKLVVKTNNKYVQKYCDERNIKRKPLSKKESFNESLKIKIIN